MPLKSICNKKLGFVEQKCILEHYREVQTRKNLLIDIIFCIEFFSDDLFRAAPIDLWWYYTKMSCSISLDIWSRIIRFSWWALQA
jgi:hypothetical protein